MRYQLAKTFSPRLTELSIRINQVIRFSSHDFLQCFYLPWRLWGGNSTSESVGVGKLVVYLFTMLLVFTVQEENKYIRLKLLICLLVSLIASTFSDSYSSSAEIPDIHSKTVAQLLKSLKEDRERSYRLFQRGKVTDSMDFVQSSIAGTDLKSLATLDRQQASIEKLKFLLLKADISAFTGDFKLSRMVLESIANEVKASGEESPKFRLIEASTMYRLGKTSESFGDSARADEYFSRSIYLFEQLESIFKDQQFSIEYGLALKAQGNYWRAKSLNKIANENYSLAISYFKKAISAKRDSSQAYLLLVATTIDRHGQTDSSADYSITLANTVNIVRKLREPDPDAYILLMAELNYERAILLCKRSDFKNALRLLSLSSESLEKLPKTFENELPAEQTRVKCLLKLAEIDSITNMHARCIQRLQKAEAAMDALLLKYPQNVLSISLKIKTLEMLCDSEAQCGDFGTALSYLDRAAREADYFAIKAHYNFIPKLLNYLQTKGDDLRLFLKGLPPDEGDFYKLCKYPWRVKRLSSAPQLKCFGIPFSNSLKATVDQSMHGKTHVAGTINEYAVDFNVPEFTPVYCALGGIIAGIKSDADQNGLDDTFGQNANYIFIEHDDGSYSKYLHLAKNGCLCKIGDVVKTGQLIGKSGNTGFSFGPHLHFNHFYINAEGLFKSLKCKFKTTGNNCHYLKTDEAVRGSF